MECQCMKTSKRQQMSKLACTDENWTVGLEPVTQSCDAKYEQYELHKTMDCNECKHQFACMISPHAIRTFESK